jgi:hypothetical protein
MNLPAVGSGSLPPEPLHLKYPPPKSGTRESELVMDAQLAIAELQEVHDRGLLGDVEVARRARAILDRSDLKAIDLVEYLRERGYRGARLVRAAGLFGRAVAEAYRVEHGVKPLKVETFVEHLGDTRSVNAYLEADRPLLDATFAEWAK